MFGKKKEVKEIISSVPEGIEEVVISGFTKYRVVGMKSTHSTLEQASKQMEGMKNGSIR